ncbi:MAG: J domain-containing protein, partial [Candidatus Kapaibacterium sp.]
MLSQGTILQFDQALSLLGLNRGASFNDVRKAYRRMALASHPDRFNNDPLKRSEAEEKMKQINAAYTWLQQNTWMFGIDWKQQAEEARQQRAQQQNAEQQHAQQQKTQQKGASDPHSTNANTKRRERTYQAPPVVDHPVKK